MLKWLRQVVLNRRWRAAAKRKRSIQLFVASPRAFFEALHRLDVPYVVLRWFDEVPMTREACTRFGGDIDLLVADGCRDAMLDAAALVGPGPIMVELYSVAGRSGMSYRGMPYYPPTMARQVLDRRERSELGFDVPCQADYAWSLMYHMVYHKALYSGITPGGASGLTAEAGKDYADKLTRLFASMEMPLPDPLSLWGMHEALLSKGYNMPYDLLLRWPKAKAWHRFLIEHDEALFETYRSGLSGLAVFIFRDDFPKEQLEPVTRQILAKFDELETFDVTADQSDRLMRQVRGGNWHEHKGKQCVAPMRVLIARSPSPTPITDPATRERYPHMENADLLMKLQIREDLQRPGGPRIFGLHSSDSLYEALHMIRVLYPDDWEQRCKQWSAQMNPTPVG